MSKSETKSPNLEINSQNYKEKVETLTFLSEILTCMWGKKT